MDPSVNNHKGEFDVVENHYGDDNTWSVTYRTKNLYNRRGLKKDAVPT